MNSFHQEGAPQYEYIYGSLLLDELHNYFPAFLYEQNTFNSVGDVFNYMNQQISRRFNPFTYGQSRYLASQVRIPDPRIQPIARAAHATPIRAAPATPAGPMRAAPASPASSAAPASPPPLARNTGILSQLFNQSLRIPGYNDIAYYYEIPRFNTNTQAINSIFRQLLQEYDSPVPITPSEDELDAHTTIIHIDDITVQNSCSICQEDYVVGDTIRKINHCTHYFHKTCIDSWFLANARCPVCRHDIRDASAAPS